MSTVDDEIDIGNAHADAWDDQRRQRAADEPHICPVCHWSTVGADDEPCDDCWAVADTVGGLL